MESKSLYVKRLKNIVLLRKLEQCVKCTELYLSYIDCSNQGASYCCLFCFLHMKRLYWLELFYAFMSVAIKGLVLL